MRVKRTPRHRVDGDVRRQRLLDGGTRGVAVGLGARVGRAERVGLAERIGRAHEPGSRHRRRRGRRRDHVLDVLPVADLRRLHQGTIARFEETYPGVTVKWEDHQATFLDDYRNAFAAGNAPDVANLSNNEGWVREFGEKDLLLNMTDNLPADVIDDYFPDLFNDSLVDGKSYQVPWYQAVPVELVNTEIFTAAGLKVEDFPKTFDGIPALCQTIKDKTGNLCDIRLTVNDYLAQMVYEGGVDVINDDGTAFTFDCADGVAWLQTYVDMVKAGTVDKAQLVTADDRTALELFTSGKAPFYNTGPQLIREVKTSNPDLYRSWRSRRSRSGSRASSQPTSMAISVKADTKFPNASLALAVFFTNPTSEVEFSKAVAVYPSTIAAYDDPFFTETPARSRTAPGRSPRTSSAR